MKYIQLAKIQLKLTYLTICMYILGLLFFFYIQSLKKCEKANLSQYRLKGAQQKCHEKLHPSSKRWVKN